MKFWLGILTMAAAFPAGGLAAPKPEAFAPPPPMPQTQTLSLYQGQSIEVPLRAIGRAPSPLRFIIRSRPLHGTLGEIRLTSNKTAVVTYAHNEKEGLAADSFSFAVQGVDGPVSAQGIITLAVAEEPPAFSATHALEFPRLWQGETDVQDITLRNAGGGLVRGKIVALSPWKVLGSGDYSLGRKQQATVRIQFAPKETGDFRDKLTFSHDPQVTVALKGSALAPFEMEPAASLQLTQSGSSTVRSATLSLHNVSPDERTLKVTAPPTVVAPAEITVAAGETKELKLNTKEGFEESLEGKLGLEGDGYRVELPLHIYAVAPRLEAQPAAIAFGEVQSDRQFKSSLTLTNAGGDAAHLHVQLPKGVQVVPDPNSEVLKPKEARTFDITYESGSPGDFREQVEFSADGGNTLSIPITAHITAPEADKNRPAPSAIPSPSPLPLTPVADQIAYSSIPAISEIKTLSVGKYDVEIGWKKPATNAASYLVEVRTLKPDKNNLPKEVWVKWPNTQFHEENGLSVARLDRLYPGQALFFRVSSLNETGAVSRPSEILRLSTPPRAKINWQLFAFLALAVGLVGYSFYRRHQQKRQVEQETEARLAHIENR